MAGGGPQDAGDARDRSMNRFDVAIILTLLVVWVPGAWEVPLVAEREPILSVEPHTLILSALKPAEHGEGVVLRISNPTAMTQQARITFHVPFERSQALRLDEMPETLPISREGQTLCFSVPPRALRTIGLD